jgi:hypothetical protein
VLLGTHDVLLDPDASQRSAKLPVITRTTQVDGGGAQRLRLERLRQRPTITHRSSELGFSR